MLLTTEKLSNLRDNYQRILTIVKNELPVGELHQSLNRLAFDLSKATKSSTINTETEQRINYLFEKYFTPEFTRFTQTAEESSQRVFREFDRLVKQQLKKNSLYNLDNIVDRKNILSALITGLRCFPHTWAKTQQNPAFPCSPTTTIDDVVYVNCGPKKPQKILGSPGHPQLLYKFDTGEQLAEVLHKRMAFILPVLTPSAVDACYWRDGEFPVDDRTTITVEFLNAYMQDASKQILAQQMKLTLKNQENGNTLDTHTLWFSHLQANDEAAFNLDAATRNLFRWLFNLLLDGKIGRVHCSSSVGRTGVWGLLYKSYKFLHQPENYTLLTRFLCGEKLTTEECQKIAMVLIHSLDTIRQIRPFIQSEEQLHTTPGQLFLILAEEYPELTGEDIAQLESLFIPSNERKTRLSFYEMSLPGFTEHEDELPETKSDVEKDAASSTPRNIVFTLQPRFSTKAPEITAAFAPRNSVTSTNLHTEEEEELSTKIETVPEIPSQRPSRFGECWATLFSCWYRKHRHLYSSSVAVDPTEEKAATRQNNP